MSVPKEKSNKSHLIELPISSFEEKWAKGAFDNSDYYALTAPLNEWSAADPFHYCLSEPAGPVTKEGWGIVSWSLVVFVYSDHELAKKRARLLGGNVEVLKLKCLACFARAFSTYYAYIDMILDESWHLESYICRKSKAENFIGGVSHVRLNSANSTFQLEGCAGHGKLLWLQYPGYDEPNRPIEWCRPVPYPNSAIVMYDHSPQGGPMDMEMLSDPENMEYYDIDGLLVAKDKNSGKGLDAYFARPEGPLSFAYLFGEKVRLTRGEGVWIPILRIINKERHYLPWADSYKPYLEKLIDQKDKESLPLSRGADWYVNHAIRALENAVFTDDENQKDAVVKAVDYASALLGNAYQIKPWDTYTHHLLRDLKALPIDQITALVHADRIGWQADRENYDEFKNDYESSIGIKQDYELALENMATGCRRFGDNDSARDCFNKLLKLNPNNARALFHLAILASEDGDEDQEMRLYKQSAKADPLFTPSLYNMGWTYEHNGNDDEAIRCYEKALKANPYHVEVIEQLAFIRIKQEKYDTAADLLFSAVMANRYRVKTYQNILGVASDLPQSVLMESNLGKLLNVSMEAFKTYLPREYASVFE